MAPSNPWLTRRVISYAHQGGAWERPSSTLAAMRHAVDVGATAIELDVHATADRQLVVCHDATVDRTTQGVGAIADLTLAELRRLDPAHWFVPGADVTPDRGPDDYPYRGRAPQDPELRIATLDEVLDAFPGVVLNLDIKQTAPVVEPYEAELADVLRNHQRNDDVIVASFSDAATDAFRAVAPEIPTSAGTAATAAFWQALHQGDPLPVLPHVALQVPETTAGLTVVDEQFVAAAHGAGLAVHVWTVEDQGAMERLVDLGVDGIITDLPTTLDAVLRRRGVRWSGLGAAG